MAKIAILAGEPSGDLIASQLMAYVRSKVKNIEFIGVGGPLMKQQGLNSFFDYSNLSLYGVFQVIPNIPKLIFLRYKLINYLRNEKPDIFIGVDAPDFNFYIEKRLKQRVYQLFIMLLHRYGRGDQIELIRLKNLLIIYFQFFPMKNHCLRK